MGFALVIGYAIGYFLRKLFTEYQIKEAEARRIKILEEAEKEVENRLRAAEVEPKENSLVIKTKLEKEMKSKRDNLRELEKELEEKNALANEKLQQMVLKQNEAETQKAAALKMSSELDEFKFIYP